MRSPFISRGRHEREMAKARRAGALEARAERDRAIADLWSDLAQEIGPQATFRVSSRFYSRLFYTAPIRYTTGRQADV